MPAWQSLEGDHGHCLVGAPALAWQTPNDRRPINRPPMRNDVIGPRMTWLVVFFGPVMLAVVAIRCQCRPATQSGIGRRVVARGMWCTTAGICFVKASGGRRLTRLPWNLTVAGSLLPGQSAI